MQRSIVRDVRVWQLVSLLLLVRLLVACEAGPSDLGTVLPADATPTIATYPRPAASVVAPTATSSPTGAASSVGSPCWSVQSAVPTATPGPPPFYGTHLPGRSTWVFPCRGSPSTENWLAFAGIGIDRDNRRLLETHPKAKAPVLSFRYPSSWRLIDRRTGYVGGNQVYLDFALVKHEVGVPESKGETPAVSDVDLAFGLLLDNRSPHDFYDTIEFGPSASGQVIEHGTFNGYPAMFASYGNAPNGIERQVLFEVSRGVMVSISAEFPLVDGSSRAYVQQTLAEIDGILASVRADADPPTPAPTLNAFPIASVTAKPK